MFTSRRGQSARRQIRAPLAIPRLNSLEQRNLPAQLVVTSAADDGSAGTLRAVVAIANGNGEGDTITFDPAISTITLAQGQLTVSENKDLTIDGGGTVTVRGAAAASTSNRLFDITTSGTPSITFSNLTLTERNLSSGDGAAIRATGQVLQLAGVTLVGNTTTGFGGAISAGAGASLTLLGCTLTGNSATQEGGGIFAKTSAGLTISGTELRSNSAGRGGAISAANTSVAISESTVSANVANSETTSGSPNARGGGVFLSTTSQDVTCSITQSTVSGNLSNSRGGGVYVRASNGRSAILAVVDDLVSGNSAGSRGGGIYALASNGTVGVTISQTTVTGNSALSIENGLVDGRGGGVYVNSFGSTAVTSTTVSSCTLSNNTAGSRGGGVHAQNTVIADCTVTGNTVGYPGAFGGDFGRGGGVYIWGTLGSASTISRTVFSGNAATARGGGVHAESSGLAITDCTVTGNFAGDRGGGIYAIGGTGGVTINHTTVTWNSAGGSGGGVYLQSFGSTSLATATISTCTVSDNYAGGRGGGVFARNCGLTISDTTVSGNTAGVPAPSGLDFGRGGGVYLLGAAGSASSTITHTVISGNSATQRGGGLHAQNCGLTISDAIVSGNTAGVPAASGGGSGRGGGVYLLAFSGTSSTMIVRSSIAGNSATQCGGGIHQLAFANQSSAALSISESTISGNTTASLGGGVYALAANAQTSTVIAGSTVAGNRAGGGGGLFVAGSVASASVTNSTFSGNAVAVTADSQDGRGGAILAKDTFGPFTLRNNTITDNSAVAGGGGVCLAGPIGPASIESNIIAGNSDPGTPDLRVPAAVPGNYNLIGVAEPGTLSGVSNLVGTQAAPLAALLAPLANYGGPTPTHALLPGSPALDAGSNPANLASDQRGFARVVGKAADIGAYEVQGLPLVAAVVVNDGSTQRSTVTKLSVTLTEGVVFPNGINAAFQLVRTGPGGPTGAVNLIAVQSGATVTLTFAPGGAVGLDPGNSLTDGLYQLTAVGTNIQGAAGFLDGNGDGVGGDNFSQALHRFYGDADGDRDVDLNDFATFRVSFGGASTPFDFDNDGDVDTADFGQFRTRFGVTV